MDKTALSGHIADKGSYLCVGLDTDAARIPSVLHREEDPVFAFNKRIIDATADLCVAYKLNTAFYERRGLAGWQSLERTLAYLPSTHFLIADAKRGDIGNTAHQYAKTFFETYPFDAVTVAPYMGKDSVEPFLQYPGKWAIVLGLTSNEGSRDFQMLRTGEGELLYEKVLQQVSSWGNDDNLMFVIGATRGAQFAQVRRLLPEHFLLVPGVGAQGGDLQDISRQGLNAGGGLLVNVSRGILYAGSDDHFEDAARAAAQGYRDQMRVLLEQRLQGPVH